MSASPRPYVFRTLPHLVEKVWGGRALQSRWGKALPADGPYGEAWEVADLPEGQSKVANGPCAGLELGELVGMWGAELVGPGRDAFPLLVKILDARDDLSVQVHPGPDDLSRLPGARSKDECWLILESHGGTILHGVAPGIEETAFRAAVAEGRAEEALRRVEVAAGELHRVPPGTVHAICSGVQLLEIQQPSDTTFRVWDYERPGLDGVPRELHLEEALSVMRWDAEEVPTARLGDTACEPLVRTDHYSVAAWSLDGPARTWRFGADSPTVVFVLEGSLEVEGCEVSRGETAVIPAALAEVEASGEAEVVIARA